MMKNISGHGHLQHAMMGGRLPLARKHMGGSARKTCFFLCAVYGLGLQGKRLEGPPAKPSFPFITIVCKQIANLDKYVNYLQPPVLPSSLPRNAPPGFIFRQNFLATCVAK